VLETGNLCRGQKLTGLRNEHRVAARAKSACEIMTSTPTLSKELFQLGRILVNPTSETTLETG
jgi:hypothetical protein